jgi:myo-inositol-1(or 4)-monophosphatase
LEQDTKLKNELNVVKQAVQEAGEAIVRIANEYYQTAAEQADRSVVTKADLEADRILKERLTGAFPHYGWLSEETREDKRRFASERTWIVDPMDGTREFVMRNPEYVVSVALVERGEPILGVIYNPLSRDLYAAVQGEGTTLNGQSVSCQHDLAARPKVEVSRSDIEKGRFSEYEADLELLPCGSIAYKLARLAVGRVDATLSVTPKNEWDIAAGVILVEEAGGRVTDLAGEPYVFNQADTLVNGVIAATEAAYEQIRNLVKKRQQP